MVCLLCGVSTTLICGNKNKCLGYGLLASFGSFSVPSGMIKSSPQGGCVQVRSLSVASGNASSGTW